MNRRGLGGWGVEGRGEGGGRSGMGDEQDGMGTGEAEPSRFWGLGT